jgi:hypothetical protein
MRNHTDLNSEDNNRMNMVEFESLSNGFKEDIFFRLVKIGGASFEMPDMEIIL